MKNLIDILDLKVEAIGELIDTANDIIPTQNLETKVSATADGIRVTNATSPVSVYTASGVLMGTQKDDVVTFDVPQGVYMVSIGSNVYKVTVIK